MEFEALQENKDDLDIQYRMAFGSVAGRRVLSDILVTFCHFGSFLDPDDKEAVGQYNVGVSILGRVGVFNAGKEKIVEAILNVQI